MRLIYNMSFIAPLLLLSLLFSGFESHIISMTYNQSNASIAGQERGEFFSIQTSYDHNRFELNNVSPPKSTELSFWYVLSSTLEFGLQYDGTRLYNSNDGSLLHKANSRIISFYYRFKPQNKLNINYKIGAFYGEVSVDGVHLSLNNYELSEKSIGYGLVFQKKLFINKIFDTYSYIDVHYILNNHHLKYIENGSLIPNSSRFLRSGLGFVFDFNRFQLAPYITCNDGYCFGGGSFSLLFKKF